MSNDLKLPGPSSSPYSAIAVVVVVLVALMAFGAYHIVPPGYRGISVTLGKVATSQLPEGLTFKLPVMQTIYDFPIKQLRADGKAESFSSDLQNITVSFAVLYRIPETQVVSLFREYKGEPYYALIEPRIQEAIKQVAAVYRAENLVKNREQVKEAVLKTLRSSIGDLINIADLLITNIDLSDQLEQAIEQKVVREQEALAKQFELEREKKEAEITIVKAEAEARAVQIKGEALKTSPEVIQFEIARKWDGKAPLSVAVGQGGANVLLPLK